MQDIFSLKVFFILLRETFESAIIISILLSFLRQNFHHKNAENEEVLTIDKGTYKSLQLQVWFGAFLGLFICLLIGVVFVTLFYLVGENYWSKYERNWEAIFSILSSLIISIMGLSLLRINTMQKKWKTKLSMNLSKNLLSQQQAGLEHEEHDADFVLGEPHRLEITPKEKLDFKTWIKQKAEQYSLMVLPMVTLLREGLEAIFVISGVSASEPLTTLPLSIISAVTLGSLIGVSLYKGGNKMRLQFFLIGSTCFLYLVSAGLMSRGVWFLELEQYVKNCHGQNMAEVGNGPGSYDIINTIWHVNCCSGINDGGWMLLNAIFGWNNTATYGSVISYNFFWVFIVIMLKVKLYEERTGHLPFVPIKWQLKKIRKRYELIKFNMEHNVNYKSTAGANDRDEAYEEQSFSQGPNSIEIIAVVDDTSDASTGLLGGSRG